MALTKRQVDALAFDPSGPATQIHCDDGPIPGFGVRVFPTGRKSFVIWYRTAFGRKRMATRQCGNAGPVRKAARWPHSEARRNITDRSARQRFASARDSVAVGVLALVTNGGVHDGHKRAPLDFVSSSRTASTRIRRPRSQAPSPTDRHHHRTARPRSGLPPCAFLSRQ
jgi:hypothetical protein